MEQTPNNLEGNNESLGDKRARLEREREAAVKGRDAAYLLKDLEREAYMQHVIATREEELQRINKQIMEAGDKDLDFTSNENVVSINKNKSEETYDFSDDREANKLDKKRAA